MTPASVYMSKGVLNSRLLMRDFERGAHFVVACTRLSIYSRQVNCIE